MFKGILDFEESRMVAISILVFSFALFSLIMGKNLKNIEEIKNIPLPKTQLEIVLSTNDTIQGTFIIRSGFLKTSYLSIPDSVIYQENQIVSIKKIK